jgi:hypothetical protein
MRSYYSTTTSGFPLSDPHPHPLLHKTSVIDVLRKRVYRVDRTPVKSAEHFKEHLIQFNLRNILTQAPESAKSENEVGRFFHDSQALRRSLQPALWTKDVRVVTVNFRISAVNVPGTEGDFGARWKIDTVVGIAVHTDNSWKEAGYRWVVTKRFFDAGLKIWQLECVCIGNDRGKWDVCCRYLSLKLGIYLWVRHD